MKNTTTRVSVALATVALALTTAALPASAAKPDAQGAAKISISNKARLVNCYNGEPSFRSGSEQVGGFVSFNYSDATDMVRATISLKGAANSHYYVKFIQATPSFMGAMIQCMFVDGELMTNSRGNGNLTIEQPRWNFGPKTAQALQVWLSATPFNPLWGWYFTDELLAANEPYPLPAPVLS